MCFFETPISGSFREMVSQTIGKKHHPFSFFAGPKVRVNKPHFYKNRVRSLPLYWGYQLCEFSSPKLTKNYCAK